MRVCKLKLHYKRTYGQFSTHRIYSVQLHHLAQLDITQHVCTVTVITGRLFMDGRFAASYLVFTTGGQTHTHAHARALDGISGGGNMMNYCWCLAH